MRHIESAQNEYIKTLRTLKTRKGREQNGLFVVEGEKTVEEALLYAEVSCVLAEEESAFAKKCESRGADVIIVPRRIIEAVSDTKTPPAVLGVVKTPAEKIAQSGFVAALDGVADPKNVGTIIRTADAAGAAGVVLSSECADYLGPKAARAAMGSIFHINIAVCDIAEYLREFGKSGVVIAGALDGGGDMPVQKNTCVVIGNEARGVSAEIKALCGALYKIPVYGKAESLNAAVAAGIMLYDAKKRILEL